MRGHSKLEIVAAVGKIRGTSRPVAVISCYIPPSYKREENLKFTEVLSDVISEIQSKHSDV